uniref:ATPase RavA n=1 Tax=Candidatus Methanophagaceae archaeon ANME-1 ERB6 TaxID=2759912 RepID=A0A7G9Z101_9EURY|nr:ATPase RavA [Methanosarcinales archaeon ANME-1 ERB6]
MNKGRGGREFIERLREEVGNAVVGMEDVIELLAVAMLAGGHIMLEGIPGVAKTTIAKAFTKAIGLSFYRIQLTPDLMPADIIGSVFYDQKEMEFGVRKGPIFANIVLADEINRATPKTQSALLEAMQEQQVTIEGATFSLPKPFLTIATMNPVEIEGVYNLPEAQLDRFMIKVQIEYLDRDNELLLLRRKEMGDFNSVAEIMDSKDVLSLMKDAREVKVSEAILDYIYEISSRTRNDERVLLGASPRASEHLLFASKSLAFLRGREYVIPDDVKELAPHVMSHRIILKAEHAIDGFKTVDLVREILDVVEVVK